MKCSLGISNVLEEISSLSHSVVFLYLFAWSLRRAFLSLLAILWNSAFKWEHHFCSTLLFSLFFSQLFVRPPQTTILPFCISFPRGWSWSPCPVQCHEPPSIVHQALCLSDPSKLISIKSLFLHSQVNRRNRKHIAYLIHIYLGFRIKYAFILFLLMQHFLRCFVKMTSAIRISKGENITGIFYLITCLYLTLFHSIWKSLVSFCLIILFKLFTYVLPIHFKFTAKCFPFIFLLKQFFH